MKLKGSSTVGIVGPIHGEAGDVEGSLITFP